MGDKWNELVDSVEAIMNPGWTDENRRKRAERVANAIVAFMSVTLLEKAVEVVRPAAPQPLDSPAVYLKSHRVLMRNRIGDEWTVDNVTLGAPFVMWTRRFPNGLSYDQKFMWDEKASYRGMRVFVEAETDADPRFSSAPGGIESEKRDPAVALACLRIELGARQDETAMTALRRVFCAVLEQTSSMRALDSAMPILRVRWGRDPTNQREELLPYPQAVEELGKLRTAFGELQEERNALDLKLRDLKKRSQELYDVAASDPSVKAA